ncbi:MAG: response regulator [Bacteriovoracaceae bacterium]|nr:response regulator [Bacteriovoracaceae bacterium]
MSKKILIVDDSKFSRTTLGQVLKEADYEIIGLAGSASEAQNLLSSSVDILILDLVLPEINGIEFAKQVRTSFPSIKILMISSLGQEHIILEALSAGAIDFLKKPFEKKDLLEAVERLKLS